MSPENFASSTTIAGDEIAADYETIAGNEVARTVGVRPLNECNDCDPPLPDSGIECVVSLASGTLGEYYGGTWAMVWQGTWGTCCAWHADAEPPRPWIYWRGSAWEVDLGGAGCWPSGPVGCGAILSGGGDGECDMTGRYDVIEACQDAGCDDWLSCEKSGGMYAEVSYV
jgi:hypothetical protein